MKYLTLVIIVRNTINVAVNTDIMRTELEKGTPCSVRTLRECIIKKRVHGRNEMNNFRVQGKPPQNIQCIKGNMHIRIKYAYLE